MLHTRHWAILAYTGLAGMAIFKGLISDYNGVIAVLAPIGGMFIWDKLKGTKSEWFFAVAEDLYQ